MENFRAWVHSELADSAAELLIQLTNWVPSTVARDVRSWIRSVSSEFVAILAAEGSMFMQRFNATQQDVEELAAEDGDDHKFLEFLFARGLLPTYAFPTDLCSFAV
ncbi:MAG TPA: hypothetical protein VGK36_19775, partial [Candidatus Angelobacter sp.]